MRCVISSVSTSEDETAVQLKLSAVPEEVNKAVFEVAETDDLSLLLPGAAVETTVGEVFKVFFLVQDFG